MMDSELGALSFCKIWLARFVSNLRIYAYSGRDVKGCKEHFLDSKLHLVVEVGSVSQTQHAVG